MNTTRPLPPMQDILEWDVASWRRALPYWDRCGAAFEGARVLEIGGRHGGLSLYLAARGGSVVCSDLDGPSEQARALHQRHGLADRIEYARLNATALDLPEQSFDIVAFKSVLGGVGRNGRLDLQQQAIREMHRVLKPGGRLLFAENLRASALHDYLRRRFVGWGQAWRYVTRTEMADMLAIFSQLNMTSYGFFSAFGRREWQRSLLHALDVSIMPLIPADSRYILFGHAVK